jgi:hypothetical protein
VELLVNELEVTWYLLAAGVCLLAVSDWRKALYAGVLVDVLRDPVRKLVPLEPVLITLSGAAVWAVIVLVAVLSNSSSAAVMTKTYPKLRTAFHLLILAILPAAALSLISYSGGWKLAAIGLVSYMGPAIGVLAGFCFLRKERDLTSLMKFYIFVNSVMLVSVVFEYLNLEIPALGGISYDWIRYHENRTVSLMCGWYRSPDIMGLHAAHVIMFALLLAAVSKSESQFGWLLPAMWAGLSLLLSGRRKMIGIPLVFLAAFLLIGWYLGLRRMHRLLAFSVTGLLLGGFFAILFWSTDQSDDYTDYASTLFTQGLERGSDVIFGSTLGTLQESGILGAGLGSGTQGRYHFAEASEGPRTWQEDGVSRLFLEFGVPGVLLLCAALIMLARSVVKAIRMTVPESSGQMLHLGLAGIVAGDAASFAISHQQFSGDPVNAIWVTLMVGMLFKMPLLQRTPKTALTLPGLQPAVLVNR